MPAALIAALVLVSCGEDTPPPAPSPTPTTIATPAATPTPEPAALLDEAYVLLRGGRYAEAAAMFATVADRATDPQLRSTAWLGEAVAAYDLGAHGRSMALLRRALEAATHGSPEEARVVYLLGVRLNEARAFEEAVALLRPHSVLGSGLALGPSIASEYARALAGNGDVERAETVWQSLLATPGLGEQLRLPILRQRAAIARVEGDLEGRRRWLGELAALTGDPEVRHELAAVGFLLGDLDLFEAQLRAIIAETPWTEEALFAVRDLRQAGYAVDPGQEGFVYYRHGAFAQARAVLLPAAEDTAASAEELAYRTYFLAAAYDDDGFYLESVPLYDAVAVDPEAGVFSHLARYWAARALENAGLFDEAAARYDIVAGETGAGFAAEAAFRSGFSRLRMGDVAGALEAWAAQDVVEARTHYWRGRALEEMGEAEEAQRAYLDAVALQPRAFHGIEARRALAMDVGGDGRYRRLAPPPVPDWEGLAAWLATHRPGGVLQEVAAEAPELALVGLRDRAAETIQLAGARTSDPWTLLSLARTATEAGLSDQVTEIARRIQLILNLDNEALPDPFVRLRYPLQHAALLEEHGKANGLDPLLLAALIYQESRWNPTAVSVANAVGLTQVIGPTAEWIAGRLGKGDVALGELFRPAVSIEFGAYYLGVQLREFGDPHHALAAYNGGPSNAQLWSLVASWPPADFVEAITFRETRAYVQLVMEHYAWYRALYGEGTGG
ncbi:MAG: transglycosylase SLT domain-containing protein [Chloroflexi bacterium]|nr:transglycosylase SLT domain-containing protein [Chloroflexota bacterium]